jgi:hypothetical protein
MHRLPILQSLFEVARIEKQAGNSGLEVKPVYISISSNSEVRESNSSILSITGNPKYIIFCINSPYQAFGRPSSTYYNTEVRAFINQEGNIIDKIKIHFWGIKQITFGDELIVTDFILERNDRSYDFHYSFMEFQLVSQLKFSVQMLWDLLCEVDINCKTGEEIDIYVRYYLKRVELSNAQYSIQQYQEQIAEQKDIIKQHKDLIDIIKGLTNNND